MKRFLAFVKKEFRHIFRDYRTMIILFGLPVAQILIFGYVVTNDLKDIRIAILDYSKDHVTQEMTSKILSSGYFLLEKNLHSNKEIEGAFQEGKVRQVIIFENDFAKKMEKEGVARVQLIADASDANTSRLVIAYTSAIIQNYLAEINALQRMPYQIETRQRMYYNPSMKSAYMFVPGTMALILMLVSAMMTSISIAREKEMGTMEVLLVSPLRPIQIILGKVTPYVVLAFINAITIIVLGNIVFEVPVNGSILLLMVESLLFILLALSLGILISTVSNSQQVAMFISMFALMLPTILLSGFIFPIENMPDVLQILSNIMPARWFIVILKNIMLKGTGLAYIWKETLILLLFIGVFIGLSVRKFKIRLE